MYTLHVWKPDAQPRLPVARQHQVGASGQHLADVVVRRIQKHLYLYAILILDVRHDGGPKKRASGRVRGQCREVSRHPRIQHPVVVPEEEHLLEDAEAVDVVLHLHLAAVQNAGEADDVELRRALGQQFIIASGGALIGECLEDEVLQRAVLILRLRWLSVCGAPETGATCAINLLGASDMKPRLRAYAAVRNDALHAKTDIL